MKGKELREWMLKRGKSVKENKLGTEPVSEAAAMDDSTGRRAKLSTEVKKGNVFVLDHRYTILRTLGAGAYGLVCSAKDSETNREVAIKKVQSVFADLTDAKRVLREIRLISSMNHDNILRILDIDEPESYNSFNDVYIVSELMATDMHKLLKSGHPLLDTQRKFFTYQILRALKYIHSASILHRDLKPANILLDNNCDLKICDFGLSRFVDTEQGDFQPMTEYVVTRWYRAPELLLAAEEYSAAIDIWSVGCILVEMYTRAPIFQGRDIKHQIEVICRILGKPTFSEMEGIQNRRAREFIMGLSNTPRQNFKDIVKEITPEAADLIDKLLQFDPKSRISAAEALEHPFLQEFRDPANEITADPSVAMADLEPPNEKKLGRDGIRRLMWDEMLRFHPDARERETPAAIAAERKVAALSEKQ